MQNTNHSQFLSGWTNIMTDKGGRGAVKTPAKLESKQESEVSHIDTAGNLTLVLLFINQIGLSAHTHLPSFPSEKKKEACQSTLTFFYLHFLFIKIEPSTLKEFLVLKNAI